MKNLICLPMHFAMPDSSGVYPNKKQYSISTDVGTLLMSARPQVAQYVCACLIDSNVRIDLYEMPIQYTKKPLTWQIQIINPVTNLIFVELSQGDSFIARTFAVLLSMQFTRHRIELINNKIKECAFVNGELQPTSQENYHASH